MTALYSYEPERFVLNPGDSITLAHINTEFWPSSRPLPPVISYGLQIEDRYLTTSEEATNQDE